MKHLPFEDRIEADRFLAAELSAHTTLTNGIVLALARGGVPVGFSVAERLHLPLDVVIARKLGVPWQPEVAFGAVTADTRLIDEPLIRALGITPDDVEGIVAREQAEICSGRETSYRSNEAATELHSRTAILVDDGLATGSTMAAAIRHVRRMEPSKVVVAVPVASRSGLDRVRPEADEAVCVAIPERFFSVGEWYRDFPQLSDNEVQHLLLESRRQFEKSFKAGTTA